MIKYWYEKNSHFKCGIWGGVFPPRNIDTQFPNKRELSELNLQSDDLYLNSDCSFTETFV